MDDTADAWKDMGYLCRGERGEVSAGREARCDNVSRVEAVFRPILDYPIQRIVTVLPLGGVRGDISETVVD